MPSTNKLSQVRSIAKFLLSFCGITSFGVFSMITLTSPALAVSNTSNTTTVNIPGSIALRLLDSTATSEITYLGFDLTPTPTGTSQTKRTIVDVGTSNPTGYKLYMQSNYQVGGSYTTNLVHTDSSVTDVISTNTTSSSLYWNYVNPLLNTTSVIPEHGHPDKIAQHFETINSDQIPVDINVSVDNTIVSGTYENQLLFSAVGNPNPINYNITFDASTGVPEPAGIVETADSSTFGTTISSTAPEKAGYIFRRWKVAVSGSTTPTDATATCNGDDICNPGDTLIVSALGEEEVDVSLTAEYYTIYHLTVNPNGGTWSGSTSSQVFDGIIGDTKSIANPTANATYTISYNANGQGASYTGSPTSVTRSFTGWSLAGGGSFAGGIYTFEEGDATLTAQYNATSNSFTLPAISKTGHTCKWAEGSASGTQYAGGTSRTITGNTTYYAKCTANNYTVNISNSNTTSGASSLSVPYGGSKTVTVTPSSGYYLSAVTCPTGYTCSGYSTGSSKTGTQTVTVKNNSSTTTTTLKFAGTALTLKQKCSNAGSGGVFTHSGTQYRKLANGACYTRYAVATGTWSDSLFANCPSGTGVPTLAEFQSVINTYGTGSALSTATGWGGLYWAYALETWELAYVLQVESNYANVGHWYVSSSLPLICIVR